MVMGGKDMGLSAVWSYKGCRQTFGIGRMGKVKRTILSLLNSLLLTQSKIHLVGEFNSLHLL